jgi:hypothetical protein
VSNDDFRRELNSAFDDVTGTPSSGLRDRVRSAVAQAPEARAPYWIAGAAAALIAVLIVGVLYIAGPLKPPSTVGGVSPAPTSSPGASPSPNATASPSVQPSPSAEAFVCTNQAVQSASQGTQPPVVYISGLRPGAHGSYDRLVIDLENGVPSEVKVEVRAGTTFTLSPSGMSTTLKGSNGILVTIHGADLHTSYSGPTDIVTGYPGLAEVKRIEDFEGVVQLGLGVNGPACYHAYYLTNPNRLVIDVQTPS